MALVVRHQNLGRIDEVEEEQFIDSAVKGFLLQKENNTNEANRKNEDAMPMPTKIMMQADAERSSSDLSRKPAMCAGPAAAMPKQVPKQRNGDSKSLFTALGLDAGTLAIRLNAVGSPASHVSEAGDLSIQQPEEEMSPKERFVDPPGEDIETNEISQSPSAKKSRRKRRGKHKSLIDIAELEQRRTAMSEVKPHMQNPMIMNCQTMQMMNNGLPMSASAPNQGAKKFCPYCRAAVLCNFKFCTDCGGDVAAIWQL